MLRGSGSSLMVGAVALFAGCGRQPAASQGEWPRFVSDFIETYFEANPQFAVYQGRHEFDGRLPDWTRDRGGRNAWREFHDRFLSYGGPPIPLVRRAMVGSGSPL
jgi:hypothetical protein